LPKPGHAWGKRNNRQIVPPSSLRLDTLALALVERLEASRKSWVGNEEAAQEAIRRIVHEGASAVAAECREVYGDNTHAARILAEAENTFLPRYTRLALEENQAESRPYALVPGSILPRLPATFAAFIAAELLARRFPGGWGLVAFSLPFVAMLWPEIRGLFGRKRYRDSLQELVNDMGRIDHALAALPEHDSANTAAAPAESSVPLPQRQREKQ
jgi:hypothetical protein